jgi:hypothetical protein
MKSHPRQAAALQLPGATTADPPLYDCPPIKTAVEVRDKQGNVLASGPDLPYCVHLLVDRIERDALTIARLLRQLDER